MGDSSDGVTGTTAAARQGQVLTGHAGFLITTATRAPSVHNTQPWRFRTGPDAVELWSDPRRKLRNDPSGREMLISCGAALFGLRLAVRSLGYWPVTQLLPDPARLRLLARVSIGAAAPVTGLERQMLDAVPHRHTHRGPFAPGPLPPACWPACTRRAGRGSHPRAGHRRPGLRPAGADHGRRGPPRRSQPARPGRDTALDQDRGQDGPGRHKFKEQNRIPEAEPEEFDKLVEELAASARRRATRSASSAASTSSAPSATSRAASTTSSAAAPAARATRASSKFYLSLEDDLMRIFAGDRVKNLMERMGMPDDEPIEHPWVTKSVENAQKKVEERNFDIRKNLLEYDDVMSAQRKTIYDDAPALLVGRYEPEVIDEEGKPTGEKREIKPLDDITEAVVPDVGYLLGMFADDPVHAARQGGQARATSCAKTSRGIEQARRAREPPARDLHALGREARPRGPRGRACSSVYDELDELVPAGAHRAARAPARSARPHHRRDGRGVAARRSKPPEDWDWGGIFQGFSEHFGVELPDEIVEHLTTPSSSRRSSSTRAEELYEKREKEIGHRARPPRLPPRLPGGARQGLGRSPHRHGPPARRHRPPRLRPEGPEAGVQEGGLQPLRQHGGARLLERRHQALQREVASAEEEEQIEAADLARHAAQLQQRGGAARRRARPRARAPAASRSSRPSRSAPAAAASRSASATAPPTRSRRSLGVAGGNGVWGRLPSPVPAGIGFLLPVGPLDGPQFIAAPCSSM